MKFKRSGLSGSYDEKQDILYIYYKGRDLSYGTEDPDGFVTMRSMETDRITGYLIYGFKKNGMNLDQLDYVFRCAVEDLQTELS